MEVNKIHLVGVLEGLKKLGENSIDCIVTSPPYWALRDYGVKDQLGLEPNPQDFVDKVVEILKECKRVLKPTGTIWINLGDSFYSNIKQGERGKLISKYNEIEKVRNSNWLQKKQRLLIPYRIAIKAQNKLGLILRNDITWIKQWANFKTKESGGSSMPSAVVDRFNTHSETILFFVKDQKYYFNLNKVRIPYRDLKGGNLLGKNPGDCIMFPLEPSRERHYAMFPSTLPEFCIKAGCPERVCKKCGLPYYVREKAKCLSSFNFRVRDVQRNRIKNFDRKATKKELEKYDDKNYKPKRMKKVVFKCNCNKGFEPGIVLDPFMGSGTTAIAAKKLGMNFIGFDLNKDYIKIAKRRLAEIGN